MDKIIVSKSPEQTRSMGEKLGQKLKAGDVVALYGELGAGKTCFIQGIAGGMGIDDAIPVNSPSYVIIKEYHGRIPLFHFDFYRVRDEREIYELGWEDYLDIGGVIVIEWADRIRSLLPADHIEVYLEFANETGRRITIRRPRSCRTVL